MQYVLTLSVSLCLASFIWYVVLHDRRISQYPRHDKFCLMVHSYLFALGIVACSILCLCMYNAQSSPTPFRTILASWFAHPVAILCTEYQSSAPSWGSGILLDETDARRGSGN